MVETDPKKLKNEELKRKALLIARKKGHKGGKGDSKLSSNGLSALEEDSLSNIGLSEVQSQVSESVQSSTSSDVMPFITGAKLPRAAVSANLSNLSSGGIVALTESNLRALDSEIRKRPR